MTTDVPAPRRPRVLLLATGGTIASTVEGRRKTYARSDDFWSVALPGLSTRAEIMFEAVAAIGSQDMTLAVWRRLRRRIVRALTGGAVDAIVVAHGTDTMEETAFLLDCVIAPGMPIVLTGAMRSANMIDPDGFANLADAIAVATAPDSRNCGVLVVMGGAIHAASRVIKSTRGAGCGFHSSFPGMLGEVTGAEVRFSGGPAPATLAGRFKLPPSGGLPRVDIVYTSAAMETDLAIERSAALDGIVTAGFGDGNLPRPLVRKLSRLSRHGTVIVRSSRIPGAMVRRGGEIDDEALGFVAAGRLSPQKARIALQLLLAAGLREPQAVQQAFDSYAGLRDLEEALNG